MELAAALQRQQQGRHPLRAFHQCPMEPFVGPNITRFDRYGESERLREAQAHTLTSDCIDGTRSIADQGNVVTLYASQATRNGDRTYLE